MPARRPLPGPDRPHDRPHDQPHDRDLAARRLAQIAHGLTGDGGAPAWWADHTVVADRGPEQMPEPLPSADAVGGAPPPLPRPGRHAARRHLAPRWSSLPPLPGLRPAHVTVVALVAVVALGVTTWWVTRDRPAPAASVSLSSGQQLTPLADDGASAEPRPAGGADGADGAATVTVDVAGKVRRPGIVVLDAGARVTDALAAAGGPRHGVDLTPLNLARVLVDGEQIVVGSPGAVAAPTAAAGSAGGGAGTGPLVNLNLAGPTELETLPEVGPVTALAIVAWRDEHGGFTSVDELLEVDGIGPATLEQIAPHVTV